MRDQFHLHVSALLWMLANPGFSRKQLVKEFGVDKDAASHYLRCLLSLNLLEKIGTPRRLRYTLKLRETHNGV